MLGKTDPWAIKDGDDVLINHPLFGTLWLTEVEVHFDDGGKPVHVSGMASDDSVPEGRSPMNFPITCVWKSGRDPVSPCENHPERESVGTTMDGVGLCAACAP